MSETAIYGSLSDSIFLESLANRYGTPLYIYDISVIRNKINQIRKYLDKAIKLYYAVKANPNRDLLCAIRNDIDGLDIASGGELEIGHSTGYPSEIASFAGPGKTKAELLYALREKTGLISVESMRELSDIKELVDEGAPRASILLRINPLLHIKEFAVKMGGKSSPFGIDEEHIHDAVMTVLEKPDVYDFFGIHVYSGTQCLNEDALVINLENIFSIAARVNDMIGSCCRVINIGGGFGVQYYEKSAGLQLDRLASRFNGVIEKYRQLSGSSPQIILELGRFLVAEAGLYITRVVSEKLSRGEQFYILDGGMNHNLAASGNLGSTIRKNYMVRNITRADGAEQLCTLAGPLCTPMDLMGKGVSIMRPEIGDLIGFEVSGSYGYSASPLLFLGHQPPIEVCINT